MLSRRATLGVPCAARRQKRALAATLPDSYGAILIRCNLLAGVAMKAPGLAKPPRRAADRYSDKFYKGRFHRKLGFR